MQESLPWYVIRVYPGHEIEVKEKLIDRLQTQPVENSKMQLLVPVDVLVEEIERKKYSGYILLKMTMQKDVWAVIMNTPGVTGFIGIGSRPTPFTIEDWTKIPFHQFSRNL